MLIQKWRQKSPLHEVVLLLKINHLRLMKRLMKRKSRPLEQEKSKQILWWMIFRYPRKTNLGGGRGQNSSSIPSFILAFCRAEWLASGSPRDGRDWCLNSVANLFNRKVDWAADNRCLESIIHWVLSPVRILAVSINGFSSNEFIGHLLLLLLCSNEFFPHRQPGTALFC